MKRQDSTPETRAETAADFAVCSPAANCCADNARGKRENRPAVCFAHSAVSFADSAESLAPIPPNPPRSAFRVYRYLCGVFRNGLHWWRLDFDRIARGTGLSRRTIERAIAFIRAHWRTRFDCLTRRIARVFVVEIWDRQKRPPSPTPLSPWAFAERKTFQKHAGAGFAAKRLPCPPKLAPLRRLAAFLARYRLAPCHWDNCKVVYRFGHAFLFALSALKRGFDKTAVVSAYDTALHKRHADAVDSALNRYGAAVSWEPSSTVSLAKRLLEDGRNDPDRIRDRIDALLPEKRENERLRVLCRAAFA